MTKRMIIGRDGETECIRQLEQRGWLVEVLNTHRPNTPNADLISEKAGLRRTIQVKASRKPKGYVTGGGVNPKIVAGGPIFNRVATVRACEFVIFLATENGDWRHFVVPVAQAEEVFRRNIESYFKTPRLDGGLKKQFGQADIFVGSGAFPHGRIVPDQRAELLHYENQWDLLEHRNG